MYHEIKPSYNLNHIIDTFWIFSTNKATAPFKVLPDTCTDFIFDLNRQQAFLSGVMTTYQFRALPGESNIIGIRFKIEMAHLLYEASPLETRNERVDLSAIVSSQVQPILHRLPRVKTIIRKIAFLEHFVHTLYTQCAENNDDLVLSVAQSIRRSKGIGTITDVAASHYISLRQLERRFKNKTGLRIKEFSNYVRFNHAKQKIETCGNSSLLEIAFETGFFDHAHMTHEFNRIAGEVPRFFR